MRHECPVFPINHTIQRVIMTLCPNFLEVHLQFLRVTKKNFTTVVKTCHNSCWGEPMIMYVCVCVCVCVCVLQ